MIEKRSSRIMTKMGLHFTIYSISIILFVATVLYQLTRIIHHRKSRRNQLSNRDSPCQKDPFYWLIVATKPDTNMDLMLSHTYPMNLSPVILGMGDPRLQSWGMGFGLKMILLKEKLEQMECEGVDMNSIVMFTDAYDVLPLVDSNSIVEEYLSFHCDIVFSAEANCHPDPEKRGEYDIMYPNHKDDKFRFLNSGTLIGRAKALLRRLRKHHFQLKDDDQRYWTSIFLGESITRCHDIRLDYRQSLFGCMAFSLGDYEYVPEKKRFRNNITMTFPKVIHFNGTKGELPSYYNKLHS